MENASFPQAVVSALDAPLKANLFAYGSAGNKKVIHDLGPDLRGTGYDGVSGRKKAVEELVNVYGRILVDFCDSVSHLRILPISGNIFVGGFKSDLAGMTVDALENAYGVLSDSCQTQVLGSLIEMCVYEDSDRAQFRELCIKQMREGGPVTLQADAALSRWVTAS